MRFIIEPKNTKAETELQKLLKNTNDFELISSYDPIENLSAKVEELGIALREFKQLGIALREFKQSGINWKVFKYYLKGRGLSNNMVENVMGKVEDFFKEVGLEI